MKIYKIAEKATDEMKEWFEKRTNLHISLVGKYCQKIAEKFPEYKGLVERAKVHDKSKFEEPEISPYVWITWKYKCKKDNVKFDAPEDLDEKMHEATEHHVLNNSHHPEYWCGKKSGVINKNNRDLAMDKPLDATSMPDLDIAEMVADWCGVSEEKGGNPAEWADKNIGKRWNFSPKQQELIYNLIESVWDK